MRRMVEKILKTYGRPAVLVQQDGETELFVFLQPVLSTNNQNAQRDFGPLGERPMGKYTYIGPAEPEVQTGDLLKADGKQYRLRHTEQFRDRSGAVYCWGLCVEEGCDGA